MLQEMPLKSIAPRQPRYQAQDFSKASPSIVLLSPQSKPRSFPILNFSEQGICFQTAGNALPLKVGDHIDSLRVIFGDNTILQSQVEIKHATQDQKSNHWRYGLSFLDQKLNLDEIVALYRNLQNDSNIDQSVTPKISTTSPEIEKRSSVRVTCNFETLHDEIITDMSRGGLHFLSREDYKLNQKVDLKFSLPTEAAIAIKGMVCRKNSTKVQSMQAYGLKFDYEENFPAITEIANFVESRLYRENKLAKRPIPKKSTARKVVITGMGVMTSIGTGVEQYWKNLLAGKIGIRSVEDPFCPGSYYSLAPIEKFDLDDFQDPKFYMRLRNLKEARKKCFIGREVDLNIAAIALALKDAQLEYNRRENKIGFILGSENPGFKSVEQSFRNLVKKKDELKDSSDEEVIVKFFQEDLFAHINTYSFCPLFYATSTFGFHGPSMTLNNASASGLVALHQAFRSVQGGESNVMLAGASEDLIDSSLRYYAFSRLRVKSMDGKVRPWDVNRTGFVMGEAAVTLVVEEEEHALRRGAKIYAEIKASWANQDSYHLFSPALDAKYLGDAYRESCEEGGVSHSDIDLVLPHATGTKLNDQLQTDAIRLSFPHNPYVASFASQVGHPLCVSGLLRVVTGVMALQTQTVPATLGTQKIDPKCFVKLVHKPTLARIQKVACGAISYGGTNLSMILSQPFA